MVGLTNKIPIPGEGIYTEMGEKLIIIIPKNYHKDVKRMSKPVEVTVKDLDSED